MNPITYARGISVAGRFCRVLMLLGSLLGLVSQASAQIRDQVSVVNLLVLYTPQASRGAGGISAIHKQIDQAVLEANSVLQNSRANLRIKLCQVARINFPESGIIDEDFNRIMVSHDRYYKLIRAFRAASKADLVCLVIESGSGGFYGSRGPSFTNAFTIICQPLLTGEYYLPVALSYNFGCQPDRRATLETSPFSYGYGLTFYTTTNEYFSTIEGGYGPRVPFFSNPDIIYNGVPIGIPEGQTNSANNVAVLNQMAPVIAGFNHPAPLTFPPSIQIFSPGTNAVFKAGDNIKLTAGAIDIDGKSRALNIGSRPLPTTIGFAPTYPPTALQLLLEPPKIFLLYGERLRKAIIR